MKKIGLICATLLAGLSLAGCSNLASQQPHKSSSSSSSSVKVIKQHKAHKKAVKKNKDKKSSSSANSTTATSSNSVTTKKTRATNQATQTANSKANSVSSSASNNDPNRNNYEETDSYHGDYSRFRDGTRKPSTFSNSQDYQAYLAYYQGYNYDKSTGQMTRMNDQQLNDMRQQMNKDGGQSFGQ